MYLFLQTGLQLVSTNSESMVFPNPTGKIFQSRGLARPRILAALIKKKSKCRVKSADGIAFSGLSSLF